MNDTAHWGSTVYNNMMVDARRYEMHVENVQKYFSGREDDLLIMNIAEHNDPWQPLIDFFGCEKHPTKDFPTANAAPDKQQETLIEKQELNWKDFKLPGNMLKLQEILNEFKLGDNNGGLYNKTFYKNLDQFYHDKQCNQDLRPWLS